MKGLTYALAVAVLVLSAYAGSRMQPGLDYFVDAGGPIDWLVRGELDDFFANQPLMGPLSLLVRAPFVALVFEADEPTVYLVGALPLLAALGALAIVLTRRMEADGRSGAERAAVGVACLASPLVVRAIHWGHAEELLCAALAVAGVYAAGAGRAGWAGLLVGGAVATKQWAVVAALPALLVLPGARIRFTAMTAVVVAAFYVPMLLGDPERFFDVVEAASSTEPEAVLGLLGGLDLPGSRVTPTNVWWPFATSYDLDAGTVYRQPEWLGRLTHTLILMIGLVLAALAWRRKRDGATSRDALRLLALLLLVRGALDPMSLDYYHLPLVVALAGAAAVGNRRDALVAVGAAAALGAVFVQPAESMYAVSQYAAVKNVGYLLTMAALALWLVRGLIVPVRGPAAEPAGRGEPPVQSARLAASS